MNKPVLLFETTTNKKTLAYFFPFCRKLCGLYSQSKLVIVSQNSFLQPASFRHKNWRREMLKLLPRERSSSEPIKPVLISSFRQKLTSR
jgi:hypothetical protein